MQTGAQLTAGFLLTLPFQETFKDLDGFQRWPLPALVLLAALTTALVIAPVAVHRRIAGLHIKERLVATAHWLVGGRASRHRPAGRRDGAADLRRRRRPHHRVHRLGSGGVWCSSHCWSRCRSEVVEDDD